MRIEIRFNEVYMDGVRLKAEFIVSLYRNYFGEERYINSMSFTPKELLELKAELEKIKLEHE